MSGKKGDNTPKGKKKGLVSKEIKLPPPDDSTRVVVRLLDGKRLLASDIETGKSDPVGFVWVGYDKKEPDWSRYSEHDSCIHLTKTCKTTIDPIWNENITFPFELTKPEDLNDMRCVILVRDEDEDENGGPEPVYQNLGRVEISMKDVIAKGKVIKHSIVSKTETYTLQKVQRQVPRMSKVDGYIRVAISIFFSEKDVVPLFESLGSTVQSVDDFTSQLQQLIKTGFASGTESLSTTTTMSPARGSRGKSAMVVKRLPVDSVTEEGNEDDEDSPPGFDADAEGDNIDQKQNDYPWDGDKMPPFQGLPSKTSGDRNVTESNATFSGGDSGGDEGEDEDEGSAFDALFPAPSAGDESTPTQEELDKFFDSNVKNSKGKIKAASKENSQEKERKRTTAELGITSTAILSADNEDEVPKVTAGSKAPTVEDKASATVSSDIADESEESELVLPSPPTNGGDESAVPDGGGLAAIDTDQKQRSDKEKQHSHTKGQQDSVEVVSDHPLPSKDNAEASASAESSQQPVVDSKKPATHNMDVESKAADPKLASASSDGKIEGDSTKAAIPKSVAVVADAETDKHPETTAEKEEKTEAKSEGAAATLATAAVSAPPAPGAPEPISNSTSSSRATAAPVATPAVAAPAVVPVAVPPPAAPAAGSEGGSGDDESKSSLPKQPVTAGEGAIVPIAKSDVMDAQVQQSLPQGTAQAMARALKEMGGQRDQMKKMIQDLTRITKVGMVHLSRRLDGIETLVQSKDSGALRDVDEEERNADEERIEQKLLRAGAGDGAAGKTDAGGGEMARRRGAAGGVGGVGGAENAAAGGKSRSTNARPTSATAAASSRSATPASTAAGSNRGGSGGVGVSGSGSGGGGGGNGIGGVGSGSGSGGGGGGSGSGSSNQRKVVAATDLPVGTKVAKRATTPNRVAKKAPGNGADDVSGDANGDSGGGHEADGEGNEGVEINEPMVAESKVKKPKKAAESIIKQQVRAARRELMAAGKPQTIELVGKDGSTTIDRIHSPSAPLQRAAAAIVEEQALEDDPSSQEQDGDREEQEEEDKIKFKSKSNVSIAVQSDGDALPMTPRSPTRPPAAAVSEAGLNWARLEAQVQRGEVGPAYARVLELGHLDDLSRLMEATGPQLEAISTSTRNRLFENIAIMLRPGRGDPQQAERALIWTLALVRGSGSRTALNSEKSGGLGSSGYLAGSSSNLGSSGKWGQSQAGRSLGSREHDGAQDHGLSLGLGMELGMGKKVSGKSRDLRLELSNHVREDLLAGLREAAQEHSKRGMMASLLVRKFEV